MHLLHACLQSPAQSPSDLAHSACVGYFTAVNPLHRHFWMSVMLSCQSLWGAFKPAEVPWSFAGSAKLHAANGESSPSTGASTPNGIPREPNRTFSAPQVPGKVPRTVNGSPAQAAQSSTASSPEATRAAPSRQASGSVPMDASPSAEDRPTAQGLSRKASSDKAAAAGSSGNAAGTRSFP